MRLLFCFGLDRVNIVMIDANATLSRYLPLISVHLGRESF
jgi:hypothetical protein